jgi:hypothetical protein
MRSMSTCGVRTSRSSSVDEGRRGVRRRVAWRGVARRSAARVAPAAAAAAAAEHPTCARGGACSLVALVCGVCPARVRRALTLLCAPRHCLTHTAARALLQFQQRPGHTRISAALPRDGGWRIRQPFDCACVCACVCVCGCVCAALSARTACGRCRRTGHARARVWWRHRIAPAGVQVWVAWGCALGGCWLRAWALHRCDRCSQMRQQPAGSPRGACA